MAHNSLQLSGRLLELAPLRHTPAGIPVAGGRLEHRSRREEAGVMRDVAVELEFVLLGTSATLLASAPLGTMVKLTGFLAAKSVKSARPVMHVETVEFVKEDQDGIQGQETRQTS